MDFAGNRKKYYASYLLTKSESRTIEKAFLICVKTWQEYAKLSPGEPIDGISVKIMHIVRDKVRKSMQSKEIYNKTLKEIIGKTDKPYFSIEKQSIRIGDFPDPYIYRWKTGDGKREGTFTLEQMPEMENFQDPILWGGLLAIPSNYLYLTEAENSEIAFIIQLFPDLKTETEGYFEMSNLPLATAISRIGDTAIRNKQTKKIRKSLDSNVSELMVAYNAILNEGTGDSVTYFVPEALDRTRLFRSVSLDKLYGIVTAEAIKNKSKVFYMSLDRYMKLTGLANKEKARASVLDDLLLLRSISILRTVKDDADIFGFIGKGRIRNGEIQVIIDDTYYEELMKSKTPFLMKVPKAVLRIPNDKPNEYRLCIAFLSRERATIAKTDNDKILRRRRVSSLLGKELTIPAVETLRQEKDIRHAKRRIIDPLYKVLEYLEENTILKAVFIDPETDKPITPEQTDSIFAENGGNIELLSRLTIEVEWLCDKEGYPDLRKTAKKHIKKSTPGKS